MLRSVVADPPEPPAEQFSAKLRVPDASVLWEQFGIEPVREKPWSGVTTSTVPRGTDPDQLAQLLEQHPHVEWAEAVRWRRLFDLPAAPLVPNDTNFTSAQRWYYDLIHAPSAWEVETGKPSVIVAVLDSGVMCAHPDLAANIWRNPKEIAGDGIDNDGNGFIDDINGFDFVGAETGGGGPNLLGDGDPCIRAGDPSVGNARDDDFDGAPDPGVPHGTLVAGIIAARSNNAEGVAGMCWGCTIMPVRIANPEGWVRSSDLADGITYAVNNGANVINVSLGGFRFSKEESEAVDLALRKGVVIVAASGNDNRRPVSYPAQLPNVIAVGASDRQNPYGRAPFSNWGTGLPSEGIPVDRPVDVVAPGVQIVSTYVTSAAEATAGKGSVGSPGYGRASGTSFSAPLVSGLLGLLIARYPSMTPSQLQQHMKKTATSLQDDPGDSPNAGPSWAGAGLINASLALGKPQLLTPLADSMLPNLGGTFMWRNPEGATQHQIKVIPFKNEGPSINHIGSSGSSYTIDAPVFGTGPYVVLPGMTYSWRVRTASAETIIEEDNPAWGPWSDDLTFKTRSASSLGITPLLPADRAVGVELTPTVRWANSDELVFYYEVQLSKDPAFTPEPAKATAMLYWELRHGALTTPTNSYAVPPAFPLQPNTVYFWRVRPRVQGDGVPAGWSKSFTFTTRGNPPANSDPR